MSITAAQLVAEVAIDGADSGITNLTQIGAAADEVQGQLDGTSKAAGAFAEMFQMASENMATALDLPIEQVMALQTEAEAALTGVAESAAGAATGLDDLGSQGDAAGSSLIEILLEINDSVKNVQYAVEGMSSSVTGGLDDLYVAFTEVDASATASASAVAEAGSAASEASSGGFMNLFNQIGIGIFNIQNFVNIARQLTGALLGPAISAEEVTSSLEIFTGSAEKAQKELAALASFAAHTPFETQAIDDAALKMQSVGINAKDVIPYIQSLGDALDATGRISTADLSQLVNAFDKIKTEGHLTTDVMNSFALSGIDAWGVLEKQTGKTHEQLAKLISAGLYPADKAMKDLTAGIENSPIYKGQMANDANLLTGAMSTLKSNFDQVLAAFGSPIIKAVEPLINNLSASLSSPAFKQFAGGVGKGIVTVFQDIGGAVGPLLTDLKPVGGFIQSLTKDFQDLGKGGNTGFLGQLASGFKEVKNIVGGELGKDFEMIGKQVQQLGQWWQSQMLPALKQAEPSFERLGAVMATTVAPALARIWAVGQQVARDALPPLIKAFETIEPVVVRVGGFLANQLGKALQFLAPYAVQAAQALGQFASDIISRVQPIVQGLSIALKAFLDWIGPYWPSIWNAIKNNFTTVWDIMKGAIQIAWSLISGTIKVGLDLFSGNWKKAWEDIKGAFNGAWEGIKSIAQGVWNAIGGAVKAGINFVIDQIDNFLRGLNSIHVSLPGGGSLGFNIPLIPHLATGGSITRGGFADVGEEGPERVWLPAGAQVIPNSQAFGPQSQQPIIVNAVLQVDGRLMASGLMPHIANAIRYGTGFSSF